MRVKFIVACCFLICFSANSQSFKPNTKTLGYFAIINTNDCTNCQINLSTLLASESGQHFILVFREKDRRFAPRYATEIMKQPANRVHYIISDSLANALAGASGQSASKFAALQGSKTLLTCDLQKVTLATLKALEKNYSKLLYSPRLDTTVVARMDSIQRLSNRVTLSTFEKGVLMTDYSFGTAYAFYFADKQLLKYGPATASLKQVYQWYFGDTAVYSKSIRPMIPQLKQLQKATVRAENIFATGDTVFVLYSFPFLQPKAKGSKTDFDLSTKFLLVAYQRYRRLNHYCVPEDFIDGYYLSPESNLGKLRKSFIFSLGKDNLKSPNYCFAELIPDKFNHLKFKRFLPVQLPSFFLQDTIVYEYNDGILRNNRFFFHYGNRVYNILENSQRQLQIPQHRVNKGPGAYEVDNFIADALPIGDGNFHILLRQGDNYGLAKIASTSLTNALPAAIMTQTLPVDAKTLYSMPVFGTDGALYYLNDRYRLMRLRPETL